MGIGKSLKVEKEKVKLRETSWNWRKKMEKDKYLELRKNEIEKKKR